MSIVGFTRVVKIVASRIPIIVTEQERTVQTMRDRLIHLIMKARSPLISLAVAEIIADYLLENGVIVPPCKIGDKVYMLVTRHTHSFEFPHGKMVRKDNQHTFIKKTRLTKSNFFKVIDDFGKTVFLTKEEAEAKLREYTDETK